MFFYLFTLEFLKSMKLNVSIILIRDVAYTKIENKMAE